MPTNVLYRLIQENPKNIPGISCLSYLKHPEGKNYLLLELPIKQTKGVGDYILTSHHLNVNETIGAIDLDSQYHYTAYFTDKAGKKYRLHIFYNEHDGSITEPLFDEVTDNTPKRVDCFEHHETFKLLANAAKEQAITHIRKIQNDKVKALESEFFLLERNATELSKDLKKNKAAYLESIDKQIAVLEQLRLYANKNPVIVRFIPYLKRLKNTVEFKVEVKTQVPEGKKQQSPNSKTKKKNVTDEFFPEELVKDEDMIAKAGLSQEITALQKKFDALKTLTGNDLIHSLTDIFAKITEMEFELDMDVYISTEKNIRDLQMLKNNLENQGKKLLLISLTSKCSSKEEEQANYFRAKKLHVFHSCLMDPVIKLDLIKRNKPLLIEFLVKNKLLSLQELNELLLPHYFKQASLLVTPAASTAAAPVASASSGTDLLNCLNIIIENGASLMEIDKISGLPFVVVLLLNPKHPLSAVLESNANLTINNSMFLNQLIHVLRVLEIQKTDVAIKEQISLLIDRCMISLSALKATKQNVGMVFLAKSRTELLEQAKRTFGDALIEKLHADPGIIALGDYVNREWLKLIAKLPLAAKLTFNNFVKKNLEQTKHFLAFIKTKGIELTFEVLKSLFIKYQRYSLEAVALNERLFGIASRLKQIRAQNKINKEQRVLLKEQQRIIDRLELLQKILGTSILEPKSLEPKEIKPKLVKLLKMIDQMVKNMSDKSMSKEDLMEQEQVVLTKFAELPLNLVVKLLPAVPTHQQHPGNANSTITAAQKTDFKSSSTVSAIPTTGQTPSFFSATGVDQESPCVGSHMTPTL